MCEIFACCRVTSRLCYSQTWRPFWFIVACVISFGAVYAMTIGGWGLIAPPVDYALAGLLAIGIWIALILIPFSVWAIIAVGYCCCYNTAWDPFRGTWNQQPTGCWSSCYDASRCFSCSCPGVIPCCSNYCSEVEREIQNDKNVRDGYTKETQNRMPPPILTV